MKYLALLTFVFLFHNYALSYQIKLEKVIDLEKPWGSSFINKDTIVVTEKEGSIKLINIKTKQTNIISHNLNILIDGQGGLLDIIFKNEQVWVTYSENRGNRKTSTSIASGNFDKNKIKFKNIFRAEPPIQSGYHFGSRLVIKDNQLYASLGERGKGMIAQDSQKHPGSIIRLNLDGSIPNDNPHFEDKKNWLPEIYQIGVRNPQGMSFSPFDNKIYISNHGAKGGDWFGEVKKSENYGWKILGWGGTNYSGTKIGPKWKPGYTKAIKYWVPSIATSAISIYSGNEFSEWNGHALITSLKDMSLRKLDFKNKEEEDVIEEIIFKNKIGRLRDIQIQPETGKIFLLTTKSLWKMEKN